MGGRGLVNKKKDVEEVIVDAGFAYKQAVEILNEAEKKARKQDDPATLTTIAAIWVELGNQLVESDGIVPSDEPMDKKGPGPIGFAGGNDGDNTTEGEG